MSRRSRRPPPKSKYQQLIDAVMAFEASDRTPANYLGLIAVTSRVLQPADGLDWRQVARGLNAALPGKPQLPIVLGPVEQF